MADFAFGPPGKKPVYIDKHPDLGEFKVHSGGRKSRGYYTDDRQDAIDTAHAMHGKDIHIVHRSKRYGMEDD